MGPISPIKMMESFDRAEKKAIEKTNKKLAHEIALAIALPFWIIAGILMFFAILLAIL